MRHRWLTALVGLLLLAWGLSLAGWPVALPVGGLVEGVLRLWPVLLVVWGARTLYQALAARGRRRGQGLALGLAVLALGASLLMNNLGWGHPPSPWAALLIGGGAGLLLQALLTP